MLKRSKADKQVEQTSEKTVEVSPRDPEVRMMISIVSWFLDRSMTSGVNRPQRPARIHKISELSFDTWRLRADNDFSWNTSVVQGFVIFVSSPRLCHMRRFEGFAPVFFWGSSS